MSMEKEQYEAQIKALKEEIELLKKKQTYEIKRQKYGLNWIDVPEAFEKDSENKIPVLEEVKEKSIKNDDGKPTHILIEGDNYHALQCLNYTHKGKVDVIYIDPPYNTGSDGFIYKDARFLEEYPDGTEIPEDHPLRHSYWLSFMSKRLKLAQKLLSKTGVIFISIDDNEYANLKLLCDQIFNSTNFVTTIVVEMSTTQGMKVKAAKDGNIVKNKEYILVYSNNNKKNIGKQILYDSRPDYDDHYNKFMKEDLILKDLKDVLKELYPDLPNKKLSDLYSEEKRFRMFVEQNNKYIFADDKITGFNASDYEVRKVYKINKNGRTYYIYNNGTKIRQLLCLKDSYGETDDFKKSIGLRKIRGDWWKDFYKDMGNVSKEGNVVYENGKKPVRLIKQVLKLSSSQSSVILDFFAGSGTTLHATMKLNEEDGGNRQCILVQLNENNICEEVTYERNRRVMQGYTNSKGEQIPGLGNSLKYYKTAFIGQNNCKNANDDDRTELAKKAGCLLSLGENTLDEICSTEYYQLFTGSKEATAVYFTDDYEKFDEFKEKVAELAPKYKKIFVYIFAWSSADDFAYEFEDVPNIQIKAIPLPILEIYKSINNA